jgi:hypothetical protein
MEHGYKLSVEYSNNAFLYRNCLNILSQYLYLTIPILTYLYPPCNVADGINLGLAVLCDNFIRDGILVFNQERVELDLVYVGFQRLGTCFLRIRGIILCISLYDGCVFLCKK